jgi:hypothetical protein
VPEPTATESPPVLMPKADVPIALSALEPSPAPELPPPKLAASLHLFQP